MGKLYTYFFIH